MRHLLVLLLTLLSLPAVASEGEALDLAYEAADALDAAHAEFEAGRPEAAQTLLEKAETTLVSAERTWPGLPRIAFERARLALLRKKPAAAEEALRGAMRARMPELEHLRMAALLDEARQAQGKASLARSWATAETMRNAGLAVVAGGAVLTGIGLAVAYGSFDDAAKNGVTDGNLSLNNLGWGLTAAGGGVVIGGTGLSLAGQVQLGSLQGFLPGPWRLPQRHPEPEFRLGLRIGGPLPAPRLARKR